MKCKGMEGLRGSEVEKYSLEKVELLWTCCTLMLLLRWGGVGLKWEIICPRIFEKIWFGFGAMLWP